MSRADSRMGWIDLVKGTSVVLVVLMHASLTLPQVAGDTSIATFWNGAGNLLEPLRMPVFFLVSGMLATSAVRRSWAGNRRRTWGIGYFYVLWTLILAAVTTLLLQQGSPLTALTSIPGTLLFAGSGYWYLYALVLFFVVARLTRDLPPLLVVGAAALLNIFRPITGEALSSALDPLHPGSLAPTMALNLVFFLVGVHYKAAVGRISRYASIPTVALLGAALAAAGGYRLVTPGLWGHTFLPLSVGWIVWAIMAAHLATGSQAVRRAGSYLGARTMPIYVVQFPLLAVIPVAVQAGPASLLASPIAQIVYPVAVTVLIVATALGLHTAVQGTRLGLLFHAPQWAVDPGAAARRTRKPVRIPLPRVAAETPERAAVTAVR